MQTIHSVVVRLSAFADTFEGGFSTADCFLADFVDGGLFELTVGTHVRATIGADNSAIVGGVVIGDELAAAYRAFGADGDLEVFHGDLRS